MSSQSNIVLEIKCRSANGRSCRCRGTRTSDGMISPNDDSFLPLFVSFCPLDACVQTEKDFLVDLGHRFASDQSFRDLQLSILVIIFWLQNVKKVQEEEEEGNDIWR